MKVVSLGFLPKVIQVDLENLLPIKSYSATAVSSPKYRQMVSSIREVGLIEPLIVGALDRKSGKHPILDGHLRVAALREIGLPSAACLISTDDEAYTYNKRVNRLSTIQEHFMIRRAVERGVSPLRLAAALSMNIDHLVSKINLLDGVCAEALSLLRDREFSPKVMVALRKMKPTRQIECVELMVSANSVLVGYAEALLAATPDEMLISRRKKVRRAEEEHLGGLERENANLRARYRLIEQTYADDVLNMVVAKGYIGKLVGNPAVEAYLHKWHADLLPELSAVAAMSSLED